MFYLLTLLTYSWLWCIMTSSALQQVYSCCDKLLMLLYVNG